MRAPSPILLILPALLLTLISTHPPLKPTKIPNTSPPTLLQTTLTNDSKILCSTYIHNLDDYTCVQEDPFELSAHASFFRTNTQGFDTVMKVSPKNNQTLNEVEVLRMVSHCPYVGKIMHFLILDKFVIVIFPFYARGTLSDILNKKPAQLNHDAKMNIVLMISKSIFCLHTYLYAHGDITLHNIFLSKNYTPFLVNFEQAFTDSKIYQIESLDKYSSPEMVLFDANDEPYEYTFLDDVYAAGIVFYFMFTNKFPINLSQLFWPQINKSKINFNPDVTKDFVHIIMSTISLENKRLESNYLYFLIENCIQNPKEVKLGKPQFYILKDLILKDLERTDKFVLYLTIGIIGSLAFLALLVSTFLWCKQIFSCCPCFQKKAVRGRVSYVSRETDLSI